jgi:hypothetical protein
LPTLENSTPSAFSTSIVGSSACASTSNGQPEKLSPSEKKIEFCLPGPDGLQMRRQVRRSADDLRGPVGPAMVPPSAGDGGRRYRGSR